MIVTSGVLGVSTKVRRSLFKANTSSVDRETEEGAVGEVISEMGPG